MILIKNTPFSINKFKKFVNSNLKNIIYTDNPFYTIWGFKNVFFTTDSINLIKEEKSIENVYTNSVMDSIDKEIHKISLYPLIVSSFATKNINGSFNKTITTNNIIRNIFFYRSIGFDEKYNCIRISFRVLIAYLFLRLKIVKSKDFGNLSLSKFLKKRNNNLKVELNKLCINLELDIIQKICVNITENVIRNIHANYELKPLNEIRFTSEWSPLACFYIAQANKLNIKTISGLHGHLWETLLHRKFKSKVFEISANNSKDLYPINGGEIIKVNKVFNEVQIAEFDFNLDSGKFDAIIVLTHGYTGMSNINYNSNFKMIDSLLICNKRLIVKLHPSENKFFYRKKYGNNIEFINDLIPATLDLKNIAYVGSCTSALFTLKSEGYNVYKI